jgi:hypothetical protein
MISSGSNGLNWQVVQAIPLHKAKGLAGKVKATQRIRPSNPLWATGYRRNYCSPYNAIKAEFSKELKPVQLQKEFLIKKKKEKNNENKTFY